MKFPGVAWVLGRPRFDIVKIRRERVNSKENMTEEFFLE